MNKCDQFVFQYQTLITLLAYLKQIKLVEAYPDSFATILQTLCIKIVSIIASCNSETV